MKDEVLVYKGHKPVGTVKIKDGQLLLYPLNKSERHITTQNLNEVNRFFGYTENEELLKRKLLQHVPELDGWIKLNFEREKE